VFLLPAQVVIGLSWGAGVWAIFDFGRVRLPQHTFPSYQAFVLLLLCIPILMTAIETWQLVDQSEDDGRLQWGTAVLDLPLAENAAILADSDKYPPLYYLQQTEGIRADLDISVWPNEAAYREQLDARLAAGQTVYLARFIPGLEGIYHLRSLGPLTEVGLTSLDAMPADAIPSDLQFGDIQLRGYSLATESAIDAGQTAVTFYWQADNPIASVQQVYVRWAGYAATVGQHPANNNYPTVAWEPGEIVPDYHQWPRPILAQAEAVALQVALAPPFTAADALMWKTVADVPLVSSQPVVQERPYRAQIGNSLLMGASFEGQSRPERPLSMILNGFGAVDGIELTLAPMLDNQSPTTILPASGVGWADVVMDAGLFVDEVATGVENGRYHLIATHTDGAQCGWMRAKTDGCVLGDVLISGVPLPPNATNFEDKIGLLDVEIAAETLTPGDLLHLTLKWQSLAPISDNFTIFVQILDAQDRIVGQVDSWPVQGTYPTSQWSPGEIVVDPIVVQLDADMPPGEYRLQVGWYLLATLRRLPVVNDTGEAIDDKYLAPGLFVP
ncbi:MAG: hypothetical protein GY943_07930, partial [Chloroflexi bacterium]|nr:hypothetical protein [Chloroflexota bacterium]